MLTIKDIATLAGVSKSTVSRVLNNSGYVSQEARHKVENIVKQEGYSPSAIARGLHKGSSNTIGVIIPEGDNPYFAKILNGISEVADRNNLPVLFCNSQNRENKEEHLIQMLAQQRVSGAILSTVAILDEHKKRSKFKRMLKKLEFPIVLLDVPIKYGLCDGVFFDNYSGAYAATSKLIECGHKTIGTITLSSQLQVSKDRLNGFLQAMQDHQLEVKPEYVLQGNMSIDNNYRCVKQLLSLPELPTAFFAQNNISTIAAYRASNELGVTWGNQLSCIGFDRVDFLDYLNVPYSYVYRDAEYMGRQAMQLLINRLCMPRAPRKECIVPIQIEGSGIKLLLHN